MRHDIKIEKVYFESVISGDKRFEIRFNDRGYQKGDTIRLREIDPGYTGREFNGLITYVSSFNQKDNFVVFSFVEMQQPNAKADLPPPANTSTNNSRSTAVQSSELLGGSNV